MTGAWGVALSMPSPPWSSFHIGPVTIHLYALCILAGIFVAWTMAKRRFVARDGQPEWFENIALVAVLAGIVGARIYHVITDYELYFGAGRRPIEAFYIWQGGLGIWGGVGAGTLAVWLMCRHYHLRFGAVADVIGPALLVAQAIGRLGNWFNQELFGRPTTLPWALRIDPEHRPAGYTQYATFHPTFLYELIWCLLAMVLLLFLERRWQLARGRCFALYVVLYTFGRFFIERLRIDPVNRPGGLRLNEYTSVIVFLVGLVVYIVLTLRHRGDTNQSVLGVPPVTGSQPEQGPDTASEAGSDADDDRGVEPPDA